ncbi:type II secretion system F family protein [Enterovirga sp.]|jgi:tight adherence protein B|uniref:type II secretion system F family protein n=1 Tax=Enterovirga sp. TaxID=2026350 RepID=UPI00261DE353|nr:type II secretion system F family protein [Enterovirga sp.]MDB5591291.1 pilus assembly protein [Enterovirga sp.]
MNTSMLAASVLAAAAAGGLAYVFLYPVLSGSARAEKRQKLLVGDGGTERRGADRTQGLNRREQVAQSLKDLEKREQARNKATLETKLAQAGLSWTKGRFFSVSAGAGLLLATVLFGLTGEAIAAAAGLFIGGLGLPRWVIGYMKRKRIERYLEELPNAMDVIVRGIRSGLPLNDCLRIIASEAAEPVKSEFRYIVEQQTLGISVSEAVLKLYERVPVPESNFFAIVIGIQAKAGGNLSETLGNLSRVLRERKKMKGKVQAMSQEAKASAAIIAALPFVVAILTYLTSPNYIELLWLTTAGKIALVLSAIWMSLGVAIMRKMINFDF